ncbi:MAG TPA: 3-isopropylmalate dehydratase small subunit [Vicinamibacteria bacterium]
MSLREPLGVVTAKTVVLNADDVDTDQVIPARFLKGTSRDGLGQALFAGWRYDAQGQPLGDFVLNRPEARGAQVLVAGRNFGCGSSREHAVWALTDFGFRAVVAPSFADIFRNNALKNGLLPVAVSPAFHARLLSEPGAEVTIDLESREIRLDDGTREVFPIDPFARRCLLDGMDELQFLLAQEEAIAAYERRASGAP